MPKENSVGVISAATGTISSLLKGSVAGPTSVQHTAGSVTPQLYAHLDRMSAGSTWAGCAIRNTHSMLLLGFVGCVPYPAAQRSGSLNSAERLFSYGRGIRRDA